MGSAGQRPRARLLLMDRAGPPLSRSHPTGSRLRKKAGEVRGGLLEEDALQDRPADLKQLREGDRGRARLRARGVLPWKRRRSLGRVGSRRQAGVFLLFSNLNFTCVFKSVMKAHRFNSGVVT